MTEIHHGNETFGGEFRGHLLSDHRVDGQSWSQELVCVQRVSGRMLTVSECTGSRLATASFVFAFASQAVPDIRKQLEAMEFKWIISKILLTLKSNLFP